MPKSCGGPMYRPRHHYNIRCIHCKKIIWLWESASYNGNEMKRQHQTCIEILITEFYRGFEKGYNVAKKEIAQ